MSFYLQETESQSQILWWYVPESLSHTHYVQLYTACHDLFLCTVRFVTWMQSLTAWMPLSVFLEECKAYSVFVCASVPYS